MREKSECHHVVMKQEARKCLYQYISCMHTEEEGHSGRNSLVLHFYCIMGENQVSLLLLGNCD